MRLTRRHVTASLAALCASPLTARAHRETASHTLIKWNARTRQLDITHRFHMHDAAQGLFDAGKLPSPNLTPLRAQAKLALYTENNFRVETLGGDVLALDLIGSDYEGSNIYVYQQMKLAAAPDGLKISCSLFSGLIHGHVNDVDVNLDGRVKSIRFQKGEQAKIVLA